MNKFQARSWGLAALIAAVVLAIIAWLGVVIGG